LIAGRKGTFSKLFKQKSRVSPSLIHPPKLRERRRTQGKDFFVLSATDYRLKATDYFGFTVRGDFGKMATIISEKEFGLLKGKTTGGRVPFDFTQGGQD